jgi:hypothetical protein
VRGFADQIGSVTDEIRGGSHVLAKSIRESVHAAGRRARAGRARAASFDGVLDATRGTTIAREPLRERVEEQRRLGPPGR